MGSGSPQARPTIERLWGAEANRALGRAEE